MIFNLRNVKTATLELGTSAGTILTSKKARIQILSIRLANSSGSDVAATISYLKESGGTEYPLIPGTDVPANDRILEDGRNPLLSMNDGWELLGSADTASVITATVIYGNLASQYRESGL